MITREQIEEAFGDDRVAYKTVDIDHTVVAINLLRERVPYDICKMIIENAEHDLIFLCNLDESMPYLSVADLGILADCNVRVDEDCDCFAMFV